MITSYPLVSSAPTARPAEPPAGKNASLGTWRYDRQRRSVSAILFAAGLSAALHAGLILGIGRPPKKVVTAPVAEIPMIRLTIPKDLEEPEPPPSNDAGPAPEAPTFVPMQPDLPQLPSPSDFVQPLDFASLVERPDFSQMKIMAIPETVRGGAGRIAQQVGAIFDLADLDRIPEPVFQPPPGYPQSMKREGLSCTVIVEFIVDTSGRALDAVAVESRYSGFNDAATAGVLRWKFRPGIREGRKVNTRMRVPIHFLLKDEI